METFNLRHYVYLNTKILNDYLSSFGLNYSIESSISKTQNKGNFAFDKFMKAGKEKETSEEIHRNYIASESANFDSLYKLLSENNVLKYYEVFDDESWNDIQRNNILETLVKIEIPKLSSMSQAVSDMKPLIDSLAKFSDEMQVDNKTQAGINMLDNLNTVKYSKEIDVKLLLADDSKFKFWGTLKTNFLLVDRAELDDEFYVVGKVIKKLNKGQFEKLSPMEIFKAFAFNKQTRQQLNNAKIPKEFIDKINYPAAKLDILAIYK